MGLMMTMQFNVDQSRQGKRGTQGTQRKRGTQGAQRKHGMQGAQRKCQTKVHRENVEHGDCLYVQKSLNHMTDIECSVLGKRKKSQCHVAHLSVSLLLVKLTFSAL